MVEFFAVSATAFADNSPRFDPTWSYGTIISLLGVALQIIIIITAFTRYAARIEAKIIEVEARIRLKISELHAENSSRIGVLESMVGDLRTFLFRRRRRDDSE